MKKYYKGHEAEKNSLSGSQDANVVKHISNQVNETSN